MSERRRPTAEELAALPYTGRSSRTDNAFQDLMDETGEIIDLMRDGQSIARFQGNFSNGDSLVRTYDVSIDPKEGDVVQRTLPNGSQPTYLITQVNFSRGMLSEIPANYGLMVRKTTAIDTRTAPSITNNYHGVVHTGTGDMTGINQNINSTLENVAQTINNSSHIPEDRKTELSSLMEQLHQELQSLPPERAEEANAFVEATRQLIESADSEKPNIYSMRITGDGLKAAATNLAPAVAIIFSKILPLTLGLPPVG